MVGNEYGDNQVLDNVSTVTISTKPAKKSIKRRVFAEIGVASMLIAVVVGSAILIGGNGLKDMFIGVFSSKKEDVKEYTDFSANLPCLSNAISLDDGIMKVTAMHNTHLKENGDNGWHSYSFLIEAEGKKIVFSGDVGYPEELDPFLDGGCDAYIMETGHHTPEKVLRYAKEKGAKKLFFTHHGRIILGDYEGTLKLASTLHPDAHIMNDKDMVIL